MVHDKKYAVSPFREDTGIHIQSFTNIKAGQRMTQWLQSVRHLHKIMHTGIVATELGSGAGLHFWAPGFC